MYVRICIVALNREKTPNSDVVELGCTMMWGVVVVGAMSLGAAPLRPAGPNMNGDYTIANPLSVPTRNPNSITPAWFGLRRPVVYIVRVCE
jgi:hypothetical protein